MELDVALMMYGTISTLLTLPYYISLLRKGWNVVVYYAMSLGIVQSKAPVPAAAL